MSRSLVMVGVLLLAVLSPVEAGWHEDRAQLRQQRADLRERVAAEREARAKAAAEVIATLVEQAETAPAPGCRDDLIVLVAGLRRMGHDSLPLFRRVNVLPVDAPADAAAAARWADALTAARERLTAEPMTVLERASQLGVIDVAVEMLNEVIGFDPDHARVRKALRQVKVEQAALEPVAGSDDAVGGKKLNETERMNRRLAAVDPNRGWFSLFEAERLREGLVWDPALGWIQARHRDRYEQGFVYDLDRKRWTTLDEANAYHADPRRPWRIRTHHLDIRGTADLRNMADVATRLEAFYARIFGTYAAFFVNSRRHDPLQLALGLADHPPLVVNVYRDREQYLRVGGGMGWSAGFFRPSNGESYFYGGVSGVMYHEFTHQVLHVFTGGNSAPSWLTEGIAEYTENPVIDGGVMTFRGQPYSPTMSLTELFKLRTNKAWHREAENNEHGAGPQYAAAGSLATFCMHGDDGRYRDDFVDFLRDNYRGVARKYELWDYLGLTRAQLEARYRVWGGDGGR